MVDTHFVHCVVEISGDGDRNPGLLHVDGDEASFSQFFDSIVHAKPFKLLDGNIIERDHFVDAIYVIEHTDNCLACACVLPGGA